MKLTGLLAMFCAVFTYGSGRLRVLRDELSCAESMQSALVVVRSELAARIVPLEDLLRKAAGAVSGETAAFFLCAADRLGDLGETDFASLWAELCRNRLPSLTLGIRAELEKLGQILGRFDLEDQLSAIDRMLSVLEDYLSVNRRKYPEQRRLTLTLCCCAACLIGLIAL